MSKSKKFNPQHPTTRPCDCWLAVGECYCEWVDANSKNNGKTSKTRKTGEGRGPR